MQVTMVVIQGLDLLNYLLMQLLNLQHMMIAIHLCRTPILAPQ